MSLWEERASLALDLVKFCGKLPLELVLRIMSDAPEDPVAHPLPIQLQSSPLWDQLLNDIEGHNKVHLSDSPVDERAAVCGTICGAVAAVNTTSLTPEILAEQFAIFKQQQYATTQEQKQLALDEANRRITALENCIDAEGELIYRRGIIRISSETFLAFERAFDFLDNVFDDLILLRFRHDISCHEYLIRWKYLPQVKVEDETPVYDVLFQASSQEGFFFIGIRSWANPNELINETGQILKLGQGSAYYVSPVITQRDIARSRSLEFEET